MKLRYIFQLLFIFTAIVSVNISYAEDFFEPRDVVQEEKTDSLDEEEELQHSEVAPYQRFGRLNKDIREVCILMHFDGRREFLFNIAEKYNVKDPTCMSCKNLFKTFKTACRKTGKYKKGVKDRYLKLFPPAPSPTPDPEHGEEHSEEKHGEESHDQHAKEHKEDHKKDEDLDPDEIKFPKQREPNPEMLSIISHAFGDLAKDIDRMDSILPAIEKLKAILEDPSNKTKAEQEYFSILSSYIYAPFKRYVEIRNIKQKKVEKKLKEQERTMSVDDLFEF